MDDHTCKLCGSSAGDTTHEGDLVHGGFGSSKYDEVKLAWIKSPPSDLRLGDHLCDACVDRQVANGDLEAFSSVFQPDVEKDLSEAGLKAVFLLGAREMYRFQAEEVGSFPSGDRPIDDLALEGIRRLRARISDGTPRGEGEAHAVACILMGCVSGPNPDFTAAAEDYAAEEFQRRQEHRQLLEDLKKSCGFTDDGAQDETPEP